MSCDVHMSIATCLLWSQGTVCFVWCSVHYTIIVLLMTAAIHQYFFGTKFLKDTINSPVFTLCFSLSTAIESTCTLNVLFPSGL